jgi:copper transport protein
MTSRSCRLFATAALTLPVPLLGAASASAHAYLVESTPAAGARVAYAPSRVVLKFSEGVAPLPGTGVSGPRGESVLRSPAYRSGPRSIVLLLQHRLPSGRYLVRWHEVSTDDGHEVRGSLQFAVGERAVASSGLSQSGGGPVGTTIMRWLLIISVLIAGGFVLFRRLVLRRALAEPTTRAREPVVAASTLAVALAGVAVAAGALVALNADAVGTGYARRLLAGALIAAAAAALAVARRQRGTPMAVEVAAVVLLVLPSLTGHAVGASQAQALSVPGDLIHVAAAAFWVGGVAACVIVVPIVLSVLPHRARPAAATRILRRFAPMAFGAVLLVAATGVVRAVGELGALDQLWTTGYGRVLLAKSAVLGVALALAAANRSRLRSRSGLQLGPELAVLMVLIGLVAVLTSLSPGRDTQIAVAAATRPVASGAPVVVAGHVGDMAVGVSIAPLDSQVAATRATVIGPAGPRDGLVVRFAGRRAPPAHRCGDGCYRGTISLVDGRPVLHVWVTVPGKSEQPVVLPAPALWPAPNATLLLRRAESAWRRLHALRAVSRIASDPQHAVTTRWRFEAPDRLAYRNVPDGAEAVIVGGRRWDRLSPNARWGSSAQEPVRQPAPPWTRATTSAHLLGSSTVRGRPVWRISFLDKSTPAWFTIFVDRNDDRTLRVDMIAQSHFMQQTNGGFDRGAAIVAPR